MSKEFLFFSTFNSTVICGNKIRRLAFLLKNIYFTKTSETTSEKGVAYDVFENYKFRKEQSWNFQFEKKLMIKI